MSNDDALRDRIVSATKHLFPAGLPDTAFDKDFYEAGLDSLDVIEFVLEVEKEFNFDIPDSDVFASEKFTSGGNEPLKLGTVNKWTAYIRGRVDGQA